MVQAGILCESETLQGRMELLYDGMGDRGNGIQCDKGPTLAIGPEVFIPRRPLSLGTEASLTRKIAKWTLLLQEFEFYIYHRPGVQHAATNFRMHSYLNF